MVTMVIGHRANCDSELYASGSISIRDTIKVWLYCELLVIDNDRRYAVTKLTWAEDAKLNVSKLTFMCKATISSQNSVPDFSTCL